MYQNLPGLLIYPFHHLTPTPWQYFFPVSSSSIKFNVEIWTWSKTSIFPYVRPFNSRVPLYNGLRAIPRTSRLTRSSVSIYILFVIPHNIPCVQTFYVLNLLYMWSIDIVKVGPPSLSPSLSLSPSRSISLRTGYRVIKLHLHITDPMNRA